MYDTDDIKPMSATVQEDKPGSKLGSNATVNGLLAQNSAFFDQVMY
jgi:hypothetical protein